jgi:hypothetical protein
VQQWLTTRDAAVRIEEISKNMSLILRVAQEKKQQQKLISFVFYSIKIHVLYKIYPSNPQYDLTKACSVFKTDLTLTLKP